MQLSHAPIAFVALLLAGTLPTRASAQNPPGSTQPASPGAYTEAQAKRGEATYRTACGSCHTASAHSGESFIRGWDSRTAFDLFELIRTTMPIDNPGRLSREQYADIVAYLFKLNGLPAGDRQLPTDDEGLKKIPIEAKSPPSP